MLLGKLTRSPTLKSDILTRFGRGMLLRTALPFLLQVTCVLSLKAEPGQTCHRAVPNLTSAAGKRVASYDLQGLFLYEPLQDVLAHLATQNDRFPEHRTDMWSCASDWIEHDRSWREAPKGQIGNEVEQHCVKMLLWQGSSEEMGIEFVEDVPSQPGCVVAKSISYEKKGAVENKASSEAWRKALIAKYGPRQKYMESWGVYPGPELETFEYGGGIHITLEDHSFGDQRDKAIGTAIDNAKPTDKPRL